MFDPGIQDLQDLQDLGGTSLGATTPGSSIHLPLLSARHFGHWDSIQMNAGKRRTGTHCWIELVEICSHLGVEYGDLNKSMGI